MPEGIGIDLLEIDRLERALERYPRLAQRIFSPAEVAYAEARRRPARHLAARFAAKEAVIKALGLREGFGLADIEIEPGPPPQVRLTGRAAEAAAKRSLRLQVSLTHGRDHAAAVAVAERA